MRARTVLFKFCCARVRNIWFKQGDCQIKTNKLMLQNITSCNVWALLVHFTWLPVPNEDYISCKLLKNDKAAIFKISSQEVIQLPGQWPSRHSRALSSHLRKRSELSSSSKGFSCCSLQYLVEIGILQNSTFYKLIWIPTVNDLGGGASLRYYHYLQSFGC